MKLFLVVLLAGVWSTAVTGAPSSSLATNFPFQFQEYGLDSAETVECVKKAVTQVLLESEFKSIWDETKTEIDHFLLVEWPKCQSISSGVEKNKCQLAVVKHLGDVVNEFVKKLFAANAWELVNEIKEKVLSQCFQSNTDLFEIEEFQVPSPGAYLARFECVAKVLDKVSKTLGLQSLWEKSQPQLEHHLGKWKQCQSISNTVFRYICQVKEGAATFVIITEYVKLADAQEKKFSDAFGAEYKQTCTGKLSEISAVEIEELQIPSPGAFLVRFECVAQALEKVSKAHNLQSLWEKSQPQLAYHLGKWKQCAKCPNAFFRYICEVKEGAATFVIITEYVKSATAQNPKFSESFAAEYKKTCAGKSNVDELFESFAVEGAEACVQKIVQKLKCISAATSEAVHGTSFQNVWEEAQHDLKNLLNDLSACPNLPTTSEAAKCIAKQLSGSYSVIVKFLSQLKEANYDAYNKVKENIKKKCYA